MATEGADAGQGGGMVVIGLDVDADEVGSGLGERFNILLWLREHQVGIKKQLGTGFPVPSAFFLVNPLIRLTDSRNESLA